VLLGELGKTRPEPFNAAVAALRESLQDKTKAIEVQQQAIAAIAYTEEEAIATFIQEAYENSDAAMRIGAVMAMGHSANPRWQRFIIRELSSANPAMRLHATRASGEIQLRDAVDDVARLTDDVNQEVRLMALWALGQIGGSVARRTLADFLESDDPEMQRTAQEALQELEFFYGDTGSFFGPPSDFSGDAEEPWAFTDLLDDAIEDADDDEWD
jgi:HEAT repeat protein